MLGFRVSTADNLGLIWDRMQQAPTIWASGGRRRAKAGWGGVGVRVEVRGGPRCPAARPPPQAVLTWQCPGRSR